MCRDLLQEGKRKGYTTAKGCMHAAKAKTAAHSSNSQAARGEREGMQGAGGKQDNRQASSRAEGWQDNGESASGVKT